MKYSLIIPVYNLEQYLERCLNSIINQGIDSNEFEVIIINDGSTDDSLSIITKYVNSQSNFRVFTIANNGVSNARNQGLIKSKGEYVYFIDGDDWLYKNILKDVYNKVKLSNLDIAKFDYTKRYLNNRHENVHVKKDLKYTDGLNFIMKNENKDFYPWQYIFSRRFLLNNNVWFNKELAFCEDKEFVIRALTFTSKFKSFNLKIYNYSLERESAVSANISDRSIKDLIDSNLLIYNFANDNIKKDIEREYIKNLAITSIRNSFYILTTNSIWKRYWSWCRKVKPVINNIEIEASDKLFVLKKCEFKFYLKYYLPRALYHKTKAK